MNNKESVKLVTIAKIEKERNRRGVIKRISFELSSCYIYKCIILLILLSLFTNLIFTFYAHNSKFKQNSFEKKKNKSNLVHENFFIIDSNNLDTIVSHMFGFSISKKGILTDNYYKGIGFYEEPDPLGVYVMIRKIGNEIRINQDFYGIFMKIKTQDISL